MPIFGNGFFILEKMMNPILRIVLLGVFILALPRVSFAQKKIEQEKGVKKKDVPSAAVDWLNDAFEGKKKVKWYEEFSNEGRAYEGKFWWDKRFHSVKFDTLGAIVDVEIEIPFEELDESIRASITDYLQSEFEDYKINRLQIQYSGESDDLEDFFDEDENEGIVIRYELEYTGKLKGEISKFWEGLFDHTGAFISQQEVEVRIMDNLIF